MVIVQESDADTNDRLFVVALVDDQKAGNTTENITKTEMRAGQSKRGVVAAGRGVIEQRMKGQATYYASDSAAEA